MTYAAKETSAYGGAPVELYRFVVGGETFLYTSADVNQDYLGDQYTTEPITRTELDQSGEAEQGSLTVTIPRTNPVAEYFIAYIPEPAMGLTLYRRHRSDAEVTSSFTGTVASARFNGSTVELLCLPIWEKLRQALPKNTYQTQCNWGLYSAQCTLAKATYRDDATITVVDEDTIQASQFGAKASGYYSNGWIERTDGSRRWIVEHAGAVCTLMSPFTDLVVGETVSVYAGCDRTESVCHSKFSNVVNFLGYERVPTRNPFEKGLV